MRFGGQTAVVTGATSGLGRSLVESLVAEGAVVYALGRDQRALDELAGGLGERLRPHAIDLLIHAAGVVELGPVDSAPISALDEQYRINLRAPFLITQLLLPKLVVQKGQIVFINSGAGLTARAGWSQYAISKFGLKALADALREEVKPEGVRVMSVYPGRAATPMQAKVRALEGQPYKPDDFLQPSDVTSMVLAALSLPRSADVIDLNIRPGK